MLVRLPAYKFVGGVVLYLIIVLLTAFRTMLDEGMDAERYFTLAFGIASLVTLAATAGILHMDEHRPGPPQVVAGKA